MSSQNDTTLPKVQLLAFPAPYREALLLQKDCVGKLQLQSPPPSMPAGYLLLGEHNPVYTLGMHANPANILLRETELTQRGIELFRTDRGGDVTYHGPGQLVAYPLLKIHQFNLGPKRYIHLLEEVIIQLLAPLGIQGIRDPKAAGVWLAPTATLPLRKICAIGVRFTQGCTMHGLALNVSTDLTYFQNINPCGFIDRGVCSIASEKNGSPCPNLQEVKRLFAHYFERVFQVQLTEESVNNR